MRERPILFSAPMVRALLAGSKTQTRRIVKLPHQNPLGQWEPTTVGGAGMLTTRGETLPLQGAIFHTRTGDGVMCPHGQPGEQLWVREAWMPDPPCDGTWGYTAWAGERIGQIASVPERFQHPSFCNYRASWLHGTSGLRWTPGIHMPRWASRITLEISGVRVERLNDCSEADACAEGWPADDSDPRQWYAALWEQINGPGSWDANPWVWVVEFRRRKE